MTCCPYIGTMCTPDGRKVNRVLNGDTGITTGYVLDGNNNVVEYTGELIDCSLDHELRLTRLSSAESGVVDQSAELQSLVDTASDKALNNGTFGTVIMPQGEIRLATGIVVPRHIDLRGCSKYSTWLKPDPGVTALTLAADSNQTRHVTDTSMDLPIMDMGTHLRDFSIHGTNGQNQSGIVWTGETDHIRMDHVGLWHLDRGMLISTNEASQGNGYMRESGFWDVTIGSCGRSGVSPALEITQPVFTVPGDGVNHLSFHRLEVTYSRGIAIHIHDESATEFLRRVDFHKLMLHGSNDSQPTSDDLLLIENDVNDVQIYGLMSNSSDAGKACIRIRSTGFGTPKNIRVIGSIGSALGDGIVVENAWGLELDIHQYANMTGDLIRFEANSLGTRYAHVNVNSHIAIPDINIDPTVLNRVSGWIGRDHWKNPGTVS